MAGIIYQGLIANHNEEVFEGQIEINPENGLIENVVNLANRKIGVPRRTFSKDCIIYPGMGDIHIHSREDKTGLQKHKEEHRTAANAALNGGLVYICPMPNQPEPNTTYETLSWHENRIKEINHVVTIIPYVGIGKDTFPLKQKKVPYKAFLGPSVGNLFFSTSLEFLRAIPRYEGESCSFHTEDNYILQISQDKRTHSERRPPECITGALTYLLPAIEKYNIKAKLCHWSTGGQSFDMIKHHREKLKEIGTNRTLLEVSPMHLLKDSDMLKENPQMWPLLQMNPALQGKDHRMQLIEGLKSGFIDILASDHAPHTLDEKYKNFAKYKDIYSDCTNEEIFEKLLIDNPKLCKEVCCQDGTSGAPWLDTHSNVIAHLVKNHNFTHQDIARVASFHPGKFVNEFLPENYNGGFGKIAPGYQGSLTVINFNKPVKIKRSRLQTKCGWSPLEGEFFPGGLEAVVIKGKDCTGQFKQN